MEIVQEYESSIRPNNTIDNPILLESSPIPELNLPEPAHNRLATVNSPNVNPAESDFVQVPFPSNNTQSISAYSIDNDRSQGEHPSCSDNDGDVTISR